MIINELAETINHRKLFNDKEELDSSLLNQINLNLDKNKNKKHSIIDDLDYKEDFLKIDSKDYYYSNVIARASKTMFKCKSEKIKLKLTGTEG